MNRTVLGRAARRIMEVLLDSEAPPCQVFEAGSSNNKLIEFTIIHVTVWAAAGCRRVPKGLSSSFKPEV
eukprot:253650-Hanusia_phi.AAC.1